MNKFMLFLGLMLLGPVVLKAQIPVEVFAGHEGVQHEFFFFKNIDPKERVSLFSMARFSVGYNNELLNSSFISSQATYNITPSWGLSAGGIYTVQDFAPIVALSYTYISPKQDFLLNLFPTYIAKAQAEYEMFGLAIYTPKLTEKWDLFVQAIFGTSVNNRFNAHVFSYQQLRLGLDYKKVFQFGLGFDQFIIGQQEGRQYANNAGLFIRTVL